MPLTWFDLLAKAPPKALRRVEITMGGHFIELPDAEGETISIARLLAPTCPACLERMRSEHAAASKQIKTRKHRAKAERAA